MKKLYPLTLMMLLMTCNSSFAITTGYSSLVVFTDGHVTRPVGETEAQCIENTERITANYLAMFPGGDVVVDEDRSLPCGPQTSPLPDLDVAAWNELPLGPVCLSCPLLQPGTFEIYYPGFETDIKNLYYQFGIDQYNQEFMDLQQSYDLKSFEKEVFKLNQEINNIKK